MNRATDYFEFIADLGMTKHYGSMAATRELVDLCDIDAESVVLDVGCGVGATPSFLARAVGCRVLGVDLIERMIARSRQRARAAGVQDRVAFAVADARRLPFASGLFDAVISESVNIFFTDKVPVMREYVRVTKPGGYVGMTEMTWLQPPSPALVDAFQTVHARALDADGWQGVMDAAGLTDVRGAAHRMDLTEESKGRAERYGRWGLVKVVARMVRMLIRERRARRFMRGGLGAVSKDTLDMIGYGVFAGRKPASG